MESFQAIPKAKDLLDYTMERTTAKEAAGSTKPRFPKSQSFGYCKALRDAALSILERIQAANDYYFETQFEERLIALDEVLQKCGQSCATGQRHTQRARLTAMRSLQAGRRGTPTPHTAIPGGCGRKSGNK